MNEKFDSPLLDIINKISKKSKNMKESICRYNGNDKVNYNEKNLVIGYRGESRYYDTANIPTIYRDEEYSKEKEIRYLDTFMDRGLVNDNSIDSKVKVAVEAQHYIQKTRLLDISFNSAVAVYMAICGITEKDIEHLKKINDINYYPRVYILMFNNNFISQNSKKASDIYKELEKPGDNHTENSINYYLLDTSRQNDRIVAQSGAFVIFPDKELNFELINLEEVIIQPECIEEIKYDLKNIFNISDDTMFPDDYEKVKYAMSDVIDNDIGLKDNSEIEKFEQDIDLSFKFYSDYVMMMTEIDDEEKMYRLKKLETSIAKMYSYANEIISANKLKKDFYDKLKEDFDDKWFKLMSDISDKLHK